jgi:hypothetical protein
MKISEKIKDLFQHRPPTEEELAARAEVESERDQIRQEVGQKSQVDHIPRSESFRAVHWARV